MRTAPNLLANSSIKSLLFSLLVIFAANAPTLAYSSIYRDYVIKEAKAIKKGSRVRVVMLNGDVVYGKWGGYVGYDYTAFVTLPSDWLAIGYDVDHIVAIKLVSAVAGNI